MAESATLSPQQAAQALADVARFEGVLSTRVGALTGMVWGVVSAAIFLTYGFAAQVSPGWLVPFLWVPWTAAGMAITMCAWRLHALSMRRPEGEAARHFWPWALGFTGLFVAAIVGLNALDVRNGAFAYMLAVNALAAFGIVAAVSRRHGSMAATPMVGAGLVLLAGAFALGSLDLSSMAMAFASAGLVGASFVGASLVSFVRG